MCGHGGNAAFCSRRSRKTNAAAAFRACSAPLKPIKFCGSKKRPNERVGGPRHLAALGEVALRAPDLRSAHLP